MLLSEDDTAGDIFECKIGNLPAGETALLTVGFIAEFQTGLKFELLPVTNIHVKKNYIPGKYLGFKIVGKVNLIFPSGSTDNSAIKPGDIFECKIGNLPAGETALLTVGFIAELSVEPEGKMRFTLPTVLNPRYFPGK
jgi:hypothetical protein